MNKLPLFEQSLIYESLVTKLDLISVECPCSDCKMKDCPIIDNGTYCYMHRNWLTRLRALRELTNMANHDLISFYKEDEQ